MEETRIKQLEAYYSAHRGELVALATTLLRGDRMTAEDLVHDVFLRLLQASGTLCHNTLHALVHTSLRHQLADRWRRRQHELHFARTVSTAGTPVATDTLAICSAHQLGELLEARLARMNVHTARVLRLSLFGEKPIGQIVDELGMTYKSVENRLGAGRKELRRYLQKQLA